MRRDGRRAERGSGRADAGPGGAAEWPDPASAPPPALDADAARARLEDLLLSLPYDRALPDLSELLDRAGVPDEHLQRDDRILKVLHEAVVARPLGQPGEIERMRTEVELLTLEVEVLTARLQDSTTDQVSLREATGRLDEVSRRLQEVRGLL